jgi:hypothetical protein
MLPTNRAHVTLAVVCLWCTGLLVADARAMGQQATPAAPCTRPPIQCPAPFSTSTFVHINLEADSSAICRFNPRVIDDLKLYVGDSVQWSFCNACEADMTVQFDTTGPGPFNKFLAFLPMPSADNLVSLTAPCHAYGDASGISAQSSGDWKYSLRAKPVGAPTFPDVIDPRLEIDDRGFTRWLQPLLLVGLGLVGGFLVGRRMRSRAV